MGFTFTLSVYWGISRPGRLIHLIINPIILESQADTNLKIEGVNVNLESLLRQVLVQRA
jgi:hypothetical protein